MSVIPNSPVFLFGSPRSGTTWLAQIFDSHPDVLYRHEPDVSLPGNDIPFIVEPAELDALLPRARDYVEDLINCRTLKANGQIPVFGKSFRSGAETLLRRTAIYGMKFIEKASRRRSLRDAKIPDFINKGRFGQIRPVIKSVDSNGRAQLLTRAVDGAKTIFIIRHPCGQVGSTLRGRKIGVFSGKIPVSRLADTEQAKRRSLTEEMLKGMSVVEQLAWRWVILNEKNVEELQGLEQAKVLVYEDLCDNPLDVSRELMAFSGLEWCRSVESFLQRSVSQESDSKRYYSTARNPAIAARKWRSELDEDIVRTIREITDKSLPGQLFAET